jgi:hypothetical protein
VDITIRTDADHAMPNQGMFWLRYTGANTVRLMRAGGGATVGLFFNSASSADLTLVAGVVYQIYRSAANTWIVWSTSSSSTVG